MNYLQSFGKNNRFKKYNLEDFCQILTDQQNCLSDDFSALSKRQLMNYPFFIILKLRYFQSVLFIYHLRKLRNAKSLQ